MYLLKLKYYILAILLFSSFQVWAIDTSETVLSDSTVVQAKEVVLYEAPTTNMQQEFKPDPLKAIWVS